MNQIYHYINEQTYDKEVTIGEYSFSRYYSKKALKKKYPRGGYVLVGGVGKGLDKVQGMLHIEEELNTFYALHYSKFIYGVKGYISVGNDQYIALVEKKIARNIGLLICIIGLMSIVLLGSLKLFNDSDLDPNAKDYTPPASLNVKTDPNHIAIPGYDEIKMRADTNTAYMALWNPPDNPCYFKFTVILKKTKEIVYESGLISPGKAVSEIKMNHAITEGIYPIEIRIDTYTLNDKKTPLNKGISEAKLIAIK